MSGAPMFIKEETVRRVLSWPMVTEATKEALSAASNRSKQTRFPSAVQPARTFTWAATDKILLSMPGFVADYSLGNNKHTSLGCKLVTVFSSNSTRPTPLPNILANVLLFDNSTGQLKCIVEGSEITAWRTTAASIVATKYLYYARLQSTTSEDVILAVLGCGVQGRSHAIGFCTTFYLTEIRLWNRTHGKAKELENELNRIKETFVNPNLKVQVFETPDEVASNADVIVTATFTSEPILHYRVLKANVHINAIGAGLNYYSELDSEIYSKGKVFVDHMAGAESELKGLKAEIVGEVGEIINEIVQPPADGISIFQSMGMAAEDVTVAEAVYEAVRNCAGDQLKVI